VSTGSDTVKSLETLVDLKSRIASQQQMLMERKLVYSCENGELVPEFVKNKVLLTLGTLKWGMEISQPLPALSDSVHALSSLYIGLLTHVSGSPR